jgi:hypothetical protein
VRPNAALDNIIYRGGDKRVVSACLVLISTQTSTGRPISASLYIYSLCLFRQLTRLVITVQTTYTYIYSSHGTFTVPASNLINVPRCLSRFDTQKCEWPRVHGRAYQTARRVFKPMIRTWD